MPKVKIMIECSILPPAKKDGVAMWLIEYVKNGEAITRQGIIHIKNGTEVQANLIAIVEAFRILKKSCSALVITKSKHILNVIKNGWHLDWEKNGWRNAKGNQVKNAMYWGILIQKTKQHIYTVSNEGNDYQDIMRYEMDQELKKMGREKR